jgi:hypothetical protein
LITQNKIKNRPGQLSWHLDCAAHNFFPDQLENPELPGNREPGKLSFPKRRSFGCELREKNFWPSSSCASSASGTYLFFGCAWELTTQSSAAYYFFPTS